MTSPNPPDDVVHELTTVLGQAMVAGTLDREQLLRAAGTILTGPSRGAERLGYSLARAVVRGVQDAPQTPAEAAWQALTRPEAWGEDRKTKTT